MNIHDQIKQKRIDDSRELYLKYNGQHHELIEREMRALGHQKFHRRILYSRFERGRRRPGWIERFGWEQMLSVPGAVTTGAGCEQLLSVPGAVATGVVSSPATPTSPVTTVPGTDTAEPADPLTDFDDFRDWLKRVSPAWMTWDWKHQVYIYKRLRRVTTGECKRLMIFLPPRHGKSELVTIRYAAWRLKKEPSMNIIVGSYNQRHASKFSRKIRRVLADDAARSVDTPVHNADSSCVSPGNAGSFACRAGSSGLTRSTTIKPREIPSTPDRRSGCHGDRSVPAPSPFSFISSKPANSVAEWETTHGGGLRAVGVGGGVTGYGASLIIIDDPVKNRAEAESENQRDKVWDWFNDDIYTRLEPNGAIILIQTRWHEDDLAGRLLREMKEEGGEQWEVVDLPALAEPARSEPGAIATGFRERENDRPLPVEEIRPFKPTRFYTLNGRRIPVYSLGGLRPGCYETTGEQAPRLPAAEGTLSDHFADDPNRMGSPAGRLDLASSPRVAPITDPLGRLPGEALWPERYNEAAFERLKRKLGSYSFSALYQQRPAPAEGGLFKRSWFKIVSHAPPGLRWKRGYDAGISKNSGSDYTASLRVAFDNSGNLYIDGGFRRRIEYPELRRYILGRILAESDTEHGIELSANGNAVVQDLRREPGVRGRSFRGVAVKGDKITRALPCIALAEDGRVFLVRGAWNSEFIEEACSFPQGAHDDQIDAVSIAVQMLKEKRSRLYTF